MERSRKLKVSVSLPADLVTRIDRQAKQAHGTRSGVMERWLRQAARLEAERQLAEEIRAYYQGQPPEEQAEDEKWASLGLEAWAERAGDGETKPRRRRRSP